jgi:hypothetical protein
MHGSYQDGGLKHNNPVGLAVREAQLLWPANDHLDVAVTIGTGFSSKSPPPPSFWKRRLPGFLTRTVSFFMDSLDTEKIWREYEAGLSSNEKWRYHRLNVEMDALPELDEVAKIDYLEVYTANYFKIGTEAHSLLKSTANALVASLFYSEFNNVSRVSSSEKSYEVSGTIFCRLEHKYQLNLMKEIFFSKVPYSFSIGGQRIPISVDIAKKIREGSLFEMGWSPVILTDEESVSVLLAFPPLESGLAAVVDAAYHISGSPWSLESIRR